MSIFIKFERDEMNEIKSRIKEIQNSLFNLNSEAILSKKQVKEKSALIQKGGVFVNEAHEELARLVSFMPQINEFSLFKTNEFEKRDDLSKHLERGEINRDQALRKLKEKIGELK